METNFPQDILVARGEKLDNSGLDLSEDCLATGCVPHGLKG
jgi:hypothetical protein